MSEQPSNLSNKERESDIVYGTNEFRNLPYLPEKLTRAVVEFILRSTKLHTVIIDSVKINPDLLLSLGEALSTTSSGAIFTLFICYPTDNTDEE